MAKTANTHHTHINIMTSIFVLNLLALIIIFISNDFLGSGTPIPDAILCLSLSRSDFEGKVAG